MSFPIHPHWQWQHITQWSLFSGDHCCMVLDTQDISEQQQRRPVYSPLSGTTWVSRYQKKHSPTHHP